MSEDTIVQLTPQATVNTHPDTHGKLSTSFLRFCREKLSPFNTFQTDHFFLYESLTVDFNTWYCNSNIYRNNYIGYSDINREEKLLTLMGDSIAMEDFSEEQKFTKTEHELLKPIPSFQETIEAKYENKKEYSKVEECNEVTRSESQCNEVYDLICYEELNIA